VKICFLAGTLGRGGAERQLVYMLRALLAVRIDARVICLTRGESFENDIKGLGVRVEWIGSHGSRPVRLVKLVKSLRREPANILQCAHFYTNLYGAVAARILGIREIGAIRSDLFSEIRANGVLGRWQFNLPRHLIANSNLARNRAIELGRSPRSIHFLPNVVDVGEQAKKKDYGNGIGPIRIAFVGRLVNPKRPDLFLRAAASLQERMPQKKLHFTIAGDGPLRNQLTSLADELDLDGEQLQFLGSQTNMESIYSQTDVLVMSSDHEGTPNAILEAMACGIPTVATRVGGIPELLGEDRGLLVEPNNQDQLTNAITRVIDDANLRRRIGERGRVYAAQSHSLAGLAGHLTAIYEKVLAG
jgi:glycosyltransferase involved in cell wall biosynthesis